ncbi:hypothetical protein AMTR_s00114p00097590 [Amborella trichopoda]|uniref:Uncharacterized protein n=1 Tax=Amborella trichopoda TaxID=13333 RepID=W1NW58_AMBTC|nr:hypothetical protein AMTR_s00114p00097590 [Amborella trichopoda]
MIYLTDNYITQHFILNQPSSHHFGHCICTNYIPKHNHQKNNSKRNTFASPKYKFFLSQEDKRRDHGICSDIIKFLKRSAAQGNITLLNSRGIGKWDALKTAPEIHLLKYTVRSDL